MLRSFRPRGEAHGFRRELKDAGRMARDLESNFRDVANDPSRRNMPKWLRAKKHAIRFNEPSRRRTASAPWSIGRNRMNMGIG